jgi:carbamoylphosphate synthase large subunit
MNTQPKRVLILAAGHNELRMILALKQMGNYVISIGNKPDLPGQKYVDEYIQMDYSKKEEVLILAEKLNIDAICPCCNDFGVITASYVAQKLNLPGHDKYENVLTLHHKDRFKQFSEEYEILTPRAGYFSSTLEANNYASNAEYPIIVKPTDLGAGWGVGKAENAKEAKAVIENAFNASRIKKIVIEQFIDGSQHGFCTFLINNKVAACCSNNEYSFVNPYRVEIDTYPADNFDEVKDFLIRQIEKMAQILNLKDGIFHLQYRMKDKKPYIIEVMRRVLGNLYGVPAEKLTGVNWDYWEARARLGLDVSDFPENVRQDGFFAYKTIMAKQNGSVKKIIIPKEYEKYVFDTYILWNLQNPITNYMWEQVGFLFMEFSSQEEMKHILLENYNKIYLEY